MKERNFFRSHPVRNPASRFDNLRGGTYQRIGAMRNYRDKWNADAGHIARGSLIDWQQARSHGIGKIRIDAHGPKYWDNGRAANIPASVIYGLRDVGHADDIVRIDHHGWFRDADCSETYRGHVWQIPARNGEPVYIAGFVDEMAGYATLDASRGMLETFSDKEDAARAADSLAERCAESEREYSERWQEARTLQDENDGDRCDLRAYRKRWHDLARIYRTPLTVCDAANLREVMDEARDNFAECLARIIERKEKIEKLDVDI